MPPRYAYWTILIDDKATAFRAREREELLPTFVQLQRKNTNVTMHWFARGRLWASREAERDDFQMRKHAAAAPRDRGAGRPAESPAGAERRGSDWRPGGTHKDPRDRFKKKNRPERAWSEKDPATQRDRDKPGYAASKPRGERPWDKKPDVAQGFSPAKPRERKPWDKPGGPPRGDRPWDKKPGVAQAGGERKPWTGKPRERKPWDKPAGSAPQSDRPWQTKPTGPRAQRKPWSNKPPGGDRRPWSGKPANKSGLAPGPGKPGVAQGFSPAKPREPKPWSSKPPGSPPQGDRPREPRRNSSGPGASKGGWQDKPRGKPQGDRPWNAKPPAAGGKRPWSGKPRDQNRKPFAPRGPQSGGPPVNGAPRKRRDDEPPDRG